MPVGLSTVAVFVGGIGFNTYISRNSKLAKADNLKENTVEIKPFFHRLSL